MKYIHRFRYHFSPSPFLDAKELWKDNLSQIFMAELIFFTIQSSCCHFWFQIFSLLHFHLKSLHGFFPDCPIHGFLGNVSSSLNIYTIFSLDPLSVLTKLCFPFAHLQNIHRDSNELLKFHAPSVLRPSTHTQTHAYTSREREIWTLLSTCGVKNTIKSESSFSCVQ